MSDTKIRQWFRAIIYFVLAAIVGLIFTFHPRQEAHGRHKKTSPLKIILYPPNYERETVNFTTNHIDFPAAGLIEFYDEKSGDYVCLGGSFVVRGAE